ncbi:E3 ubiquitin-protein ligase [Escovopsis weberi]|uniref:E3 ubiquitin-protein ligase n=1 Tax=Escovopsis weberi TaxID=150374 RepID=A0A0M8MZ41_ESCWE|nr:E3 ubiquitin-protein ligase [Escovopsis weberi]
MDESSCTTPGTAAKTVLLNTLTATSTSTSTSISTATATSTAIAASPPPLPTTTTSARPPPRNIAPASTTPRQRSAQYLSRPEPRANDWAFDSPSDNLLPLAAAAAAADSSPDQIDLLSDDHFLASLAETDFSSPSTYPSFTNPTFQRPAIDSISPLGQRYPPATHPRGLQPSTSSRATVTAATPAPALSPAPPFSLHPRFLGHDTSPDRERFSGRQFTRPSLSFDLTDLFPQSPQDNLPQPATAALPNHNPFIPRDTNADTDTNADADADADADDLAADSLPPAHSSLEAMPPRGHTRGPPTTPSRDSRSSHKRRRLSAHSGQPPARRPSLTAADEPSLFVDDDGGGGSGGDGDDLFGESPAPERAGLATAEEEYTTIDLTEATEVPEELKKPVVDQRIKLSKFQCVICMDDAKNLTLTHCGHMYCAKCLHSSLHAEPTRGKCPMCRAKIDMKARDSYSSKTKGFWPLELKLMTATRKGKRKADGAA